MIDIVKLFAVPPEMLGDLASASEPWQLQNQPLNDALIEASERFAATFEEMKERE